ncbi:MAG: cytochrome c3 family protein [Candidatus Schekmanbacteria bacterium]|nr:cytochrome c3 family protein [Candidatus Schekmanbacteria bacterium]
MLKKKRILVYSVVFALGVFSLVTLGNTAPKGDDDGGEVELGTGARQSVKVDYQRVVFPHKMHQELVLRMAGNDPEIACRICHHTKKPGKDPRACRRCHAKKQVKAKGEDMCLIGCHTERGRKDLDEKIRELPRKIPRKGQLLKLKDAFHFRCKNCHTVLRAISIDLDSTKYLAPVLNCEGCHVPVDEGDRKKVEEEKIAERKRIGDVFGQVIEIMKGK